MENENDCVFLIAEFFVLFFCTRKLLIFFAETQNLNAIEKEEEDDAF